jgi:hypothetical protein
MYMPSPCSGLPLQVLLYISAFVRPASAGLYLLYSEPLLGPAFAGLTSYTRLCATCLCKILSYIPSLCSGLPLQVLIYISAFARPAFAGLHLYVPSLCSGLPLQALLYMRAFARPAFAGFYLLYSEPLLGLAFAGLTLYNVGSHNSIGIQPYLALPQDR